MSTATRNLMSEALAAGTERIVYTSSVATLRLAGATGPVDETASLSPEEAIGVYKRSKTLAELGGRGHDPARQVAGRDRQPDNADRPARHQADTHRRILLDAARGRIPAFVDTGLNFAHVDDIAEGHLLAFERGRIGERYILGGENVLLRNFLATIADAAGRRPPRIRLPRIPIFPLAYGAQAYAYVTGKEPPTDGRRVAHVPLPYVLHIGEG